MSLYLINILSIFLLVAGVNYPSTGGTPDYACADSSKVSYIQWIGQFPLPDSTSAKITLKHRLSNMILGTKHVAVSKPVAVLAENPEAFWILDQGVMSVIRVQKQMGEMPHLHSEKGDKLTSLVGICSINERKILVTDSRINGIFLINPGEKTITRFDQGNNLEQPTGIAFSEESGEIYVVETSAHRISVLNDKGERVRSFGSRGNAPGEFNFPTSLWIDKSGCIYIIDAMNFRVQIFNKEEELISVFGEIGDATGYFARPRGIATDSNGNIFITDALFHVVQIFDKSGKFLYTFGTQGRDKAQFWMPSGIFIDDQDNIYVADSYNSRVQIFKLIKDNKE